MARELTGKIVHFVSFQMKSLQEDMEYYIENNMVCIRL